MSTLQYMGLIAFSMNLPGSFKQVPYCSSKYVIACKIIMNFSTRLIEVH
jgi:hypothetical protein